MKRQNEARDRMPQLAANVRSLCGRTAVSRRRAMTIVGALAGVPLLGGDDLSQGAALLHQWTGTSLGSPSQLLLYHHDRAAATRIARECAAEIERLERIFALYRTDSEITRLNRDGRIELPSLDLLTVIARCQNLSALSNGAFDVTVQPLWTLYAAHFFGNAASPPGGQHCKRLSTLASLSTGRRSMSAAVASCWRVLEWA